MLRLLLPRRVSAFVGVRVKMTMVISASHQARMLLSQRYQEGGLPSQQHAGPGNSSSQAPQPLRASLHHPHRLPLCARCHRRSSHLCRRQTLGRGVCCAVACSTAQIASHFGHGGQPDTRVTRHSPSARCCCLRGRLPDLTYSVGGFAWQRLPAGGALPSSTRLRCILHSGTLVTSVGSVAICARSFARGLGLPMLDLTLSAVPALALQQLASGPSPCTLSPRSARDTFPQWLEALAPPKLAAGSQSCLLLPLIGGALVASSPLRPAEDHCRLSTVAIHYPSFYRGATTFPRCNPTRTSPHLQFASRVWGVAGVATNQSFAACGQLADSMQATSFMHISKDDLLFS